MPKQKDLKRLVRTRMEKTGESYTAARLQLVRKEQPAVNEQPDVASAPVAVKATPDHAVLAGMSDAKVREATGRSWAEWVTLLDAARAAEKPHREIAKYVSSLGTPSWWSQMVTVAYERIRGLREKGERRGGGYSATKSRTFNVPLETLFAAFANARKRGRWLNVKVTVRSSTPEKAMRLAWNDGTAVVIGFYSKGEAKSMVAIEHQKLPDKAAAEAMKKFWAEQFDRLAETL